MSMVTLQFMFNHGQEFGLLPANMQQVLPMHYTFPGKLDRPVRGLPSAYRVWQEQVPAFEQAARQHGLQVQVTA